MSRNIALDILKLLMAFMVVALHAGFLGEFSLLGQYITVNGIFRIAVPIFLIVNGFYFYPVLSRNHHIKWLKRVLVLYIFWMVVYSYFWFSVPDFSFVGLAKLIQKIIIGYYHLWYISGMIGAAILLIIFRSLPSFILSISIILTFLTGVLIQYIANYHILGEGVLDRLFNYHWFHRNMLFFSYPFFCVGYLINKHSLYKFVSFRLAGILSVVGILVLLGESYANYYQPGRDGGFDNYFSLLLVCPFVFILFLNSSISGSNKNIALYSSSIYFVHIAFLSVFFQYLEFEPTSLTLVTIVTSAFASYFVIKANKRLKFIL